MPENELVNVSTGISPSRGKAPGYRVDYKSCNKFPIMA